MTRLTLENVTKRFQDGDGEITAVDELSLDIDDGEFLVLVGPSGCGKSTSLRMVAGLESVTEGSIKLDGSPIESLNPQQRDVAMVFQSYALYPHMTVRENMSFGLEESTDLPNDVISESVEETAEMMGIGNLLDRKPGELSGGQQQRVALGRAIVREPEVFLMDEPLSNLDAKLRSEMRTELQRLQEQFETTTIYVTHDQTEAMTMGDRIAILDGGELQQVGTPIECYHQPANQFVAGFIGEPSMNFLPVSLEDGAFVGDQFEYPISRELESAVGDASGLTMGIRPEDIELVDRAGTQTVSMIVDVVEPMGDQNVVYLKFTEEEVGPAGSKETVVATVGGMDSIETGERVNVKIPEDAIQVFDGSGVAIRNRKLERSPAEMQF
jgi:multiple sugar transport system ATP-binding protein